MIHYLYLGHFEHDGAVVRFAKRAGDDVFQPVVRRPIDPGAVTAVLRDVTARTADHLTFPDTWSIWADKGYLICDKYTGEPAEIDFVARLVERTRCDIYDVAAHCDISLHDWLAATREFAKP
jgi:hypothetical protein